MKDNLVSRDQIRSLHPIFRGRHGERIIDLAINISGLKNADNLYQQSKHLTGREFCTHVLDLMEIKRILVNAEILEEFKDKSYITVSNHPYGHVDGLSLIEAVAGYSPNYKIMVNVILSLIDTMQENFISVNPNSFADKTAITWRGLMDSMKHLKNGNPLGFFPAGAISNLYIRGGVRLEDREWQSTVIKMINRAKKPVIPIHISGHNSFLFYAIKIFGWKARNILLCHELHNKAGKEIVLTVGEPIMPDEIAKYKDIEELGQMLKDATYRLTDKKKGF